MADHICGREAMELAEKEKQMAEYRNAPEYPPIAAQAAERGWRPATLTEMLTTEADVHTWRGGCWVRIAKVAA